MRRSALALTLLAALPLLAGCNLRNGEGLATAAVAVGGFTALAYTASSFQGQLFQQEEQRQQRLLQTQQQNFQMEEQRAQRLASEYFQRQQLEIQKDQMRSMR